MGRGNFNNRFNIDNYDNNRASRGIVFLLEAFFMKTYKNLYHNLCSFENLRDAYEKARKHKTASPAVLKFDAHWRLQLYLLRKQLQMKVYAPKPLQVFILRDPKSRKICVSDFRDRVVHHALVNILQPIFEPRFIHDSYATRVGKGTSVALQRFDSFLRKVTKNGKRMSKARNANDVIGYALKADIKHYFETVDHNILLQLISKRIKDDDILWLTQVILNHYHAKEGGKGMPLGNWTSQFFANVYLNELDQFVKHKLKAKYYLRYVDDFVILHRSKQMLQIYEEKIKDFLQTLKLELHPTKCKIIPLSRGVSILGFRFFYQYKLVRQRNIRKIYTKLQELLHRYDLGFVDAQDVLEVLYGWNAYAQQGNTYNLRRYLKEFVESELEKSRLTT
jgi:RNA-directed DNA polymerase